MGKKEKNKEEKKKDLVLHVSPNVKYGNYLSLQDSILSAFQQSEGEHW